MKKIEYKQIRTALSTILVAALSFALFIPAVPQSVEGWTDKAVAGVYAEEDGAIDAVIIEETEAENENTEPGEENPSDSSDPEIENKAELPEAGLAIRSGAAALGLEIMPLAADFPYFFHLSGQTDPFGSGHHYRQYYVPAGSDVPLLSFCMEMGKNAPPDSEKVAYLPMGAPDWSIALATYAPAVLSSYGIDIVSDNQERYWAMQDAVWALTGSDIKAAANEPVVQSLIAAGRQLFVSSSNPIFSGISDGDTLKANIYNDKLVRYGPFSIYSMYGTATMDIFTEDGADYSGAWLGNSSGNPISLSSVPGGIPLYVYLPRYLYGEQRIKIEISAPYVKPATMIAFRAPVGTNYQNQIVMQSWTINTSTVKVEAKLGGFGVCEITKLDDGWRTDYREAFYHEGSKGDVYQLDGAKFKLREWNGSTFIDSSVSVVYDPATRVYRTGFLTETATNNGRFQIVETTTPYGYRDPITITFDIRSKYDLRLDGPPGQSFKNPGEAAAAENSDGDGTFYALNTLLNVRIEMQKRDKAEKYQRFSDTAAPQGDATLAGAYYGLFYSEAVTDPSGIRREKGELVCIGVTDKSGRIVFDNSDANRNPADRKLIWNNSNTVTNYGTADFPIYLPAFERQDRRIYPALYYIQELAPSPGYLLDIDPATAELDCNNVPIPGTGTAYKYEVDARDKGTASNPAGVRIETTVTEQVKMRGFLLRKLRSDGYETEIYNMNGAGFSVYLIDDLINIIKKAAKSDPTIKVPQRGPAGWNKQDFIDFFYESDFEHPVSGNTGKGWYNQNTNTYQGRYNFELYPDLKRAMINYAESPVFYSGAKPISGMRYGDYGNTRTPQDGEVVFPEFPYGEYIVFETYVPPGHDRIKPFVVSIAEDGGDIIDGDGLYNAERPEQSWRIQVDGDMFSIRIWKKDAETGRVIIGKGAAYRLKYLGADGVEGGADDKWVEMSVPADGGSVRWGTASNPFRIGAGGVLILPKKLQAGNYKLYEVEAPSGYVLSYHEAVDDAGFYQAKPNQIHKHGYGEDEKAGDKNYTKNHYILYTPAGFLHAPQPDVGILFDINEAHRVLDFDIDEDGYDDFVIELVQYNEQQKGRLDIHKEYEETDTQGGGPNTLPFSGVRFELYAAEDILSSDGHGWILFEEGELVASAETDEKGNAYFKDLYLGKYILKEADISNSAKITINGKLVSGYKFAGQIEIDLRPADGAGLQKDNVFFQENPFICASWDMLNTWQLGRIEIHKSGEKPTGAYLDKETGNIVVPYEEEPLEGVVFEVIAADDIKDLNTGEVVWRKGDVAGVITTGEDGNGSIDNLLPGNYILREAEAPEGYIFVDDRPFTISEREHTNPFEWYTWDIFDVRQKLSIVIEKVDEANGQKLAGAVFGLYAAEDIRLGPLSSETVVENAKGLFETIAYEVNEKGPFGVVIAIGEAIGGFFGGLSGTGAVEGAAAFSLDPLPDLAVISGGTLVMTVVSDVDGKACFRDLPPGKYIVKELTPPCGYAPNDKFAPVVRLAYDGHQVCYLTWTGVCTDARAITVEVDKDTIRRTAAAFVSLPEQAGYNNVGEAEERFRYDVDFRSTAAIWVDEFVVDDPLENAVYRKVVVEELWTPVVWGDYDGLWNLWYATNKTDRNHVYSTASAMDTNPFNPDNPEQIAVYPNTGLKLFAKGLKTDRRYHFTLEDFGLDKGEYLTHLRFEYGRVEVGFTSKNYASVSLNGEHRTISGADLKLPSDAAHELMLLDPADFGLSGSSAPQTGKHASGSGAYVPGLGEKNETINKIEGAWAPTDFSGVIDNYVTGIKGDVVDWTPREGMRFFAKGALNPGYELKPASYLVSAVKPMTDVDIVNSVSARVARDITMRAYDQDAVVTKEFDTFKYTDAAPKGVPVKTGDSYPLLIWLLALLLSSIGLLTLGRIAIDRRIRRKQQYGRAKVLERM